MSCAYRSAMRDWLGTLNPWSTALTVTFVRAGGARVVSEATMASTLVHLLKRLDRNCFRNKATRKGAQVGSMAVLGFGPYGDHPHAHIALATPGHLNQIAFKEEIEKAIWKTRLLDRQYKIERFRDKRWISYCLEHGTESLSTEVLRAHRD